MSEVSELREALRWALKEGKEGFYKIENGAEVWYYCKFCHAVANLPNKLNHEDECKLYHIKKLTI